MNNRHFLWHHIWPLQNGIHILTENGVTGMRQWQCVHLTQLPSCIARDSWRVRCTAASIQQQLQSTFQCLMTITRWHCTDVHTRTSASTTPLPYSTSGQKFTHICNTVTEGRLYNCTYQPRLNKQLSLDQVWQNTHGWEVTWFSWLWVWPSRCCHLASPNALTDPYIYCLLFVSLGVILFVDRQRQLIILGEMDKLVPVSPRRVSSLTISEADIQLTLKGSPGETLSFLMKLDDALLDFTCVISGEGGATISVADGSCH